MSKAEQSNKQYSDNQLKCLLEAAIFSASAPQSITLLQETVLAEYQLSNAKVRELLDALQSDYAERGVQLQSSASGYRFVTALEWAEPLQKVGQHHAPKYSRALLETLVLIAYQQPITRGEIEKVRGVSVSSKSIQTLMERGWVRVVGHKQVPGRPALLATTKTFLDYFGLNSLSELPQLSDQAAVQALLSTREGHNEPESVNE
ncbi:SMC-Scp complex subunit ScpB [Paraferrimonas sedimenticola]|uniref:Segregation and condensation protein B n=1 Tax=Paraferrimonas sedimenticola TaxID=375674 RepID=A0AA37RRW9_9GAMM|nr:SMC-Scp complex subunit ScpB [Paraferrimonas sedimenticola]GLP94920.1 segregation and condensation protein B [Paraferrimonas sedimenticola]